MADARRPAGSGSTSWTEPPDILAVLRRRWQTGSWLTAAAAGEAWVPLSLPLRGPTATQLGSQYEDVKAWVSRWRHAERNGLRLELHTVGGRRVGVNELPRRAWLDHSDQAFKLLRVRDQVDTYLAMVAAERERAPRLVDWMLAHPHRVLAAAAEWDLLVAVVLWVDTHGAVPNLGNDSRLYLRQIDVPGADTKFIEERRGLLCQLLDLQLDPGRIDHKAGRSDLTVRYGFRPKPQYLRFRFLGAAVPVQFGGFTELTLRLDELLARPLPVSRVFAVENEITYLAFPSVSDAVVVLGSGYSVGRLAPLSWLAERELVYWGDLDTHGFAILNVLRRHFPHTRSMLMDRRTLLDHEGQWVREPEQVTERLVQLDAAESDLYQDLVENSFGPAVRLEQERIRFSAIDRALIAGG